LAIYTPRRKAWTLFALGVYLHAPSVQSVGCALQDGYGCVRVTLVSVGIDEPYESSLEAIEAFAPLLGYHNMLLWRESDFLDDPITKKHSATFKFLNVGTNQSIICSTWKRFCRPYCAAFKPVALIRSLLQPSKVDYVMWVDASKYSNYSLTLQKLASFHVSIQIAVSKLQVGYPFHGPPSMYGAAHCEHNHTLCQSNGAYMQPNRRLHPGWGPWLDQFEWSALQAFKISDPCELSNDLWLENPHLLLANTAFNFVLLQRWLSMALRTPKAFCRSHPQDQAAWAILVSHQRLPILSFDDQYRSKTLPNVLLGLSRGAFQWIDRAVNRASFAQGLSHHADFGSRSLGSCPARRGSGRKAGSGGIERL